MIAGSSRSTVTVIAEARNICSPRRDDIAERVELPGDVDGARRSSASISEERNDEVESLGFRSECNPGISHPAFPPYASSGSNELSEESQATTTTQGGPAYPPFPCPFCDRAYTSWGFRRRHIKAVHTISPRLNCKWCLQVLPTHAAWRRHVISAHNLSASDAHNGLLILEEAHMVLQIAHPTRLDTLVNIIKQSSQQSGAMRDSDSQPE